MDKEAHHSQGRYIILSPHLSLSPSVPPLCASPASSTHFPFSSLPAKTAAIEMFSSSYYSPSSTSLSFIGFPGGLICSGELQASTSFIHSVFFFFKKLYFSVIMTLNWDKNLIFQHTKASISDGGAGATSSGVKVERYSSKDRRERIERYRSKRNQRNFHKKITKLGVKYACRKTLADSRPRVRGRFARNDEAEQETDSPESGAAGSDWWRKMKAALTAAGEECYYDEEIWASLDSAHDMNLSSSAIVQAKK
ncbi:Zinc finger protein CONSTANS-LIKE 5 [Dendrobium catenatum]|uniref:Zinc finger protein CONSTANS-LIKE 5 n=1 Tax=Dendrobium catenatum TaxID=906689 RepID=A0A2I0VVK5_9ASPA|nr:Zinc finger protein CONSTANS-LIKE 5 [Dendrobium catenatum]